MRLVDQQRLYGLGLSYVDVHLLAAARLTAGGITLDAGQESVCRGGAAVACGTRDTLN